MKILFLCTLNAVRSPIAEALAKSFYPEHEFYSAGIIAGPIDYFAVEVLQELGLDISDRKTRSFENIKHKSFDLIICLANESAEEFKPLLDSAKISYKFWNDIPSPADLGGGRLMKVYGYREIRDKIKAKLKSWEFLSSLTK